MTKFNPYIEFLKQHKGLGLSREQLLDKYYANGETGRQGGVRYRQVSRDLQTGGDLDREQLIKWWNELDSRMTNLRLDEEMKKEDDILRAQFIDDLIAASQGRDINKTIFTIAHAMWHGHTDTDEISPDIFDNDERKQLAIVNECGTNFQRISHFIDDYIEQYDDNHVPFMKKKTAAC